jgi:proteasome accessory factor A
METDLSVDTMHNRPLLNTRDEPHADGKKYRRLHLILGDANMCEYATALKVGTTQLVLELIARDRLPALELEQPVAAVKQISRDADLKAAVRLKDRRQLSGLEIQESYCEAARRELSGTDPETDWVLQEWSETLRLLMKDRGPLLGKLDWVTKQWLLETFVRQEQIGWDDPWLASLDLEYHNINPECGLHRGLEAEGKVWRLTTEKEVEEALSAGPLDTRGGLRGLCIRRFPDRISHVQWEKIRFSGGWRALTLEMGDLFDPVDVRMCASLFESAASPAEALAAWNTRKDTKT